MSTEVKPSDWNGGDNRWEPTPSGGGGVPTPTADDNGKVLTAGADGTASWETAIGGIWEYEDATFYDGSGTTTTSGSNHYAAITGYGLTPIPGDSYTVTFNGTNYTMPCELVQYWGDNYFIGERNNMSPDFTNFPCCIAQYAGGNIEIYTPEDMEFDVLVVGKNKVVSDDFKEARADSFEEVPEFVTFNALSGDNELTIACAVGTNSGDVKQSITQYNMNSSTLFKDWDYTYNHSQIVNIQAFPSADNTGADEVFSVTWWRKGFNMVVNILRTSTGATPASSVNACLRVTASTIGRTPYSH